MIKYADVPDNMKNIGIEQLPSVSLSDGNIFYGLKFIPLKEVDNPNYNQQKNDNVTLPSKTIMVPDDSKNVYYDEITQELMDKKEQNQVIQDLQNGKYATNKNLMNILMDNTKLKNDNQQMKQNQMQMLMQLTKMQKGRE